MENDKLGEDKMKKDKPERYRQDKLMEKIKKIELEIEGNLGRKVLDEIYSYSFKYANGQAKVFGIDAIEDDFTRNVLFGRLYRFKMEHALFEVAECINYLQARGYDKEQIRNYFIPGRIAEVVCFE